MDISPLKNYIAKIESLWGIAAATKPTQNEKAHIHITNSIETLVAEMTHIVCPDERQWP